MHAHMRTNTHMHTYTRNLKMCLLVLLETQISLETFGVLRKHGAFSWVHPQIQEIVVKSLNIFVKIMQNGVECDKK